MSIVKRIKEWWFYWSRFYSAGKWCMDYYSNNPPCFWEEEE